MRSVANSCGHQKQGHANTRQPPDPQNVKREPFATHSEKIQKKHIPARDPKQCGGVKGYCTIIWMMMVMVGTMMMMMMMMMSKNEDNDDDDDDDDE